MTRAGGQEFLLVLLNGRYDGLSMLAIQAAVPDPLHELFLLSRDRLAPALRNLAGADAHRSLLKLQGWQQE